MAKPTSVAAVITAHKPGHQSIIYRRATPIDPLMEGRFANFIAGALFRNIVIGVIVFSAILMGIETTQWAKTEPSALWLRAFDTAVTGFFVLEVLAKLVVFRQRFFRDGWNIFDLLIVLISLVPATQGLRIIRTLRVLRILRLLSAIPSMRLVITGLLKAIPGMLSAIALLLIVIYVFAILSIQLFGDQCYPGYLDKCEYFFGDLGRSLYTLFQIMTLESWSHGIVRPVADIYPWAQGFFVVYVTVTAFAALNLFIGVVVNAMDSAREEDDDKENVVLESLQKDLADIKKALLPKQDRQTPDSL